MKLITCGLDGSYCLINRRNFKGPFLQVLVINGKPITLELQQLNRVTAFADKNINVSIQNIFAHTRSNDARQSMKTFSHVDCMAEQEIPALF